MKIHTKTKNTNFETTHSKMEGKGNLSENGDKSEEQGRMFLFFLVKNFST